MCARSSALAAMASHVGELELMPAAISHGEVEDEPLVHTKTLMAYLELGRTLSRKVNMDVFLFKATKASKTTK
jgi:hypothetical protein